MYLTSTVVSGIDRWLFAFSFSFQGSQQEELKYIQPEETADASIACMGQEVYASTTPSTEHFIYWSPVQIGIKTTGGGDGSHHHCAPLFNSSFTILSSSFRLLLFSHKDKKTDKKGGSLKSTLTKSTSVWMRFKLQEHQWAHWKHKWLLWWESAWGRINDSIFG